MRRICFVSGILFAILFCRPANGQMRQIYSDLVSTNNNIQKLSFYSPSSGYIASTDNNFDWVGFTSDSGHTILKKFITNANVNFNGYNVNLTFGFGLKGVKAFNQDTVIAYGDYGSVPAILYSINGGNSYTLIFHSLSAQTQFSSVYDMVFPENSTVGFAVDGYRILKTTDKGLNWFTVSNDVTSPYDALDGIDNSNVFAFSRFDNGSPTGKLVKTTNGGAAWQQVSIPDPHIFSADFITANKGWLNVYENTDSMLVYYTANGGNSWTKKNNGSATPVLFNKIQFVNDSTGYGIPDIYATYKTSDSGKVWEPIVRDNNFEYLLYGFNDIQVINPNQLWSGGARDFLELNTTGGEPRSPGAHFNIDTADVNSTNQVHLVNYSRTIYQCDWYVNNVFLTTGYNATYTHALSSPYDSVQLIVRNGTRSDTLVKYQAFIVPNLPVITSFYPSSGSVGTFVTLKGSSFTGVTSVKFGGVTASSFTVLNDTVITATVSAGASGAVSVTDIHGTYSLTGFTYFPPPVAAPPVITSFTPESDLAGATVTLTGQNFDATAQNNTVYFGLASAPVLTASPTQITCTVPPGGTLSLISVLNRSTGLTGYSNKPFSLVFADSSNFTTNSFNNTYTIDLGNFSTPKYVMGSDLDGDGKPDIILTKTPGGDSLCVFRNTSPGSVISFAPQQNLGRIGVFSGARFNINDMDGDGKPDILCTSNETDIYLYRNTSNPGSIQFAPRLLMPTSSGSQSISVDDLDNDGRPDLAVGTYNQGKVSILRNTSSVSHPSFAQKIDLQSGGGVRNTAICDLDGDGKKDVLAVNFIDVNNSVLSYFKNQSTAGNISFAAKVDIPVAGSSLNANGVHTVDYDGDNKPDIILVNDNNSVFLRNTSTAGNISFAAPVSVAGLAYDGIVDNLSGHRKPDLMTGNRIFRYFTLTRNISTPGNILNDAPVNIERNPVNIFSTWSNTADFNMDGKPDIIASSADDHLVAIYQNKIGVPVPFAANFACQGGSVQRGSDLSGTTYQWQQNTGTGFVNISDNATFSGTQTSMLTINNLLLAWNGYLYRCVVDANKYSSSFILTVNTSAAPSVSISTPTNTVCNGSTVTFTATGTPTSPVMVYQWNVNGSNVGTNSPVYTTNTLTNNAQVKVFLINPCATPSSAVSNTITMTVLGLTPSVTVSASSTSACAGAAVTFTATPVNGGATPSYQWQVNGVNAGTNSNVFTTTTLNNNDQVKVLMTATPGSCGTFPAVSSNTVTMTIAPAVTPSVTLVSNNNPFCQGGSILITATPVNGGTNPFYQWQQNGINITSGSNQFNTSFVSNGDQIRVIMTSNATCPVPATVTSNIITVSIIPNVVPAVSISGNTSVIAGQSSLITTSLTNGGAAPLYRWQDSVSSVLGWADIAGATNATINYIPAQTGVKLRCIITSNANCAAPVTAISNRLTFTVSPVTAIPPVSASGYAIRHFPNPARTFLYIDSLKVSDKWQTAEIMTMSGIRLRTVNIANRSSVALGLEKLIPGQYIVVLRRKNGAAYLKFIKQ